MPLDPGTQWGVALAKGNGVRLEMAELRGEIRELSRADGRRKVATVLRDGDLRAEPMKVRTLLKTPHRMGEAFTRTVLTRVRIDGDKRVRDLDEWERERLAAQMDPDSGPLPKRASPRPKPEPTSTPAPVVAKPVARLQVLSNAPVMVPAGPFVDWLQARFSSPTAAIERLGVPKIALMDVWHGRTDTIKEDIVDRALLDWPERLDDLYPDLAA